MFAGITTEICAQAWELILPGIGKAASTGLTWGENGSIVVLDPNSPDGAILFAGRAGEGQEETLEYATAKAALTWRTGEDSSRVSRDLPHLYAEGDIKWPGAVKRAGLVVAFSGVQGEFDEMISEWMISAIRGICRDLVLRPGGAAQQKGAYLTR